MRRALSRRLSRRASLAATAAGALALALACAAPAGSAGPAESVAAAGARVEAAAAATVATTGAAGEGFAAEGVAGAVADRAAEDAALAAALPELAAALVACEAALADLRGAVTEADARETRLAGAMAARRIETGRLLAALEAFVRAQDQGGPELHPGGPMDAARARTMLATLAPQLEAEAQALAGQLRELGAARDVARRGFDSLAAGLAQLDAGRGTLIAALAAPDAPRVETPAVAREAATVSELVDRLAGPGEARAEPLALRWPMVAATPAEFRAPDAAGARLPGIRLAAAPLTLVTAPAAGRVLYAGPFLDYGYVVVLAPRADVTLVLAGMATLAAETGENVPSGGLLGLLGGRALTAQEFLMAGSQGNDETRGQTLYIELRHGRGPVDPAPWFQGRNG